MPVGNPSKQSIATRKYEAKDISDFRKKYGKEKTLKLIEQAKEYYLNG